MHPLALNDSPLGHNGQVPPLRVRTLNDAPVQAEADFVLYWMTTVRRPTDNYCLDHAIDWAKRLKKPLVVLESLICDYPWASDRLHTFILEGMADNQESFDAAQITYWPYVETHKDQVAALLTALAAQACLVVGDDFPGFFLPAMLEQAGQTLAVRFDVVDTNGLLPLRATERPYPTAYAFRRLLHTILPPFLEQRPESRLSRAAVLREAKISKATAKRFPKTSLAQAKRPALLASLPIDHSVQAASFRGGHRAAQAAAQDFVHNKLLDYAEGRNHPDDDASSGLSPYLHFGHLSAHTLFGLITAQENWTPDDLSTKGRGQREGWWNMSPAAESFLDEAITWRELGYIMSAHNPDHTHYKSLPPWAQATLAEHAQDKRPYLYDLKTLTEGRTHDPLWNAAQNQLRCEGRLHNYMRMLWGKKILEWSPSPEKALKVTEELNNRYAVDGRDPNSYSGIFWIFGRYDRPWPERPIFGKIRYMSSANTARKLRLKAYVARHSQAPL